MRHTYTYILSVFLLSAAFSSCQHDAVLLNDESAPTQTTEPGLYCTIGFAGEGDESNTTRTALEVNNTLANVNDVYAIYFQNEGSGYKYKAHEEVKSYLVSGTTKAYRLIKYPTGSNIEIAFLGNAGVNGMISATTNFTGKTQSQVLETLVLSTAAANSAVWTADNNATHTTNKYIPLYVSATGLTLTKPDESNSVLFVEDKAAANATGSIFQFVRMVSKFTLTNNYTDPTGTKKKIQLKEVYVINGNDKGALSFTNYATTNIPAGTSLSTENSTNKLAVSNPASNKQELVFYTFEAPLRSTTKVNDTNNCYLYLRGWIDGASTREKTYMLHIPAASSPVTTAGPILRNRHYQYTINGVDDYERLFLEVTVVDWVKATIVAGDGDGILQ